MFWNQPRYSGKDKPKASRRDGKDAIVSTAVAVVLVAGVSGVAYWCLSDGRDEVSPSHDEGRARGIAEAKPATNIVDKADAQERIPPEEKPDPNARPTKVGEAVNGYVMLPSGRIHKPTGVVTNRVASYGKSKYSIFKHRSDNEIAAVLMMNSGDTIVGTKRYDRWFTQQFLKSIETPIIVSQDDEPWQADLKRLVVQARLELKTAYDNGEDIAAIMSESRQQLQDLSKYKQSIKQIYAQNMKECATEAEVGELQRAVNIMLEEKGCAPMNFTPLTKLHLMKENTHE